VAAGLVSGYLCEFQSVEPMTLRPVSRDMRHESPQAPVHRKRIPLHECQQKRLKRLWDDTTFAVAFS
jgi:hypothetical protein